MKRTASPTEEAGIDPNRLEILRKIGEKTIADRFSYNLVLLVARRGRMVFHEVFGHQGPDPGSPSATKDTIYPLNSLTKSFTAALAMILISANGIGIESRYKTRPGKRIEEEEPESISKKQVGTSLEED